MDNTVTHKKGHGCLIAIILFMILVILICSFGYKFVVSLIEKGTVLEGSWDCKGSQLVLNEDKTYSWKEKFMKGTYEVDGSIKNFVIKYDAIFENHGQKSNYKIMLGVEKELELIITDLSDNTKTTCIKEK